MDFDRKRDAGTFNIDAENIVVRALDVSAIPTKTADCRTFNGT